MNKKRVLILILAILAIGAAIAWYQFSRGHADMASVSVDEKVTANAFYSAFTANEADASARFIDHIIEVTGSIVAINDGKESTVVTLKGGDMGGIICSMTPADFSSLKEGNQVTLVGECTGVLGDADLGLLDVNLVRCVIK